ncbi:ERP2 [Giardia lamblia P15]|uniref:ERP2 n=1 Tax=Giardia intestinalis (strain P15) TaxID=658858 RepID=E1F546_GIAIA|nr:ERP2 [Giardia lamblia P15]
MLIWTLLTLSLSLMVKVNPGETRCFRDRVKKDDRLSINVHVSGGNRLSFTLRAPNQGILKQDALVKSWSHALSRAEAGYYEFCASSPSNNKPANMTLFWLSQPSEPTDMPTGVLGILNQTSGVVKHLVANQRFTQTAEISHKQLISSLSSSLSFWMVIKIIVVVVCIAYQMAVTKKYFTKRKTAV